MKIKSKLKYFIFIYIIYLSNPPLSFGEDVLFKNFHNLHEMLDNAANLYNLDLIIRDEDVLTKKVFSGYVNYDGVEDLFNKLADLYNFSWFIYSNKLYITKHKIISQDILVDGAIQDDVEKYLFNKNNFKTLPKSFSVVKLPSQNKILITGSREFISIVEKLIKKANLSSSSKEVMIFYLKFAKAKDTKYTFNSENINVPGVATLLNNLFYNNTTNYQNNTYNQSFDANKQINNQIGTEANIHDSPNMPKNNPLVSQPKNPDSSFGLNPSINTDERLNAIIILDDKRNMNLYKNLIEKLDVPADLVQISLTIMSIDQDLLSEQGVSWWLNSGKVQASFGAVANSSPGNALSKGVQSAYSIVSPGQLIVGNMTNFLTSIDFLSNKNIAKVQSKPSLVTIDNLPAIFTYNSNFLPQKDNSKDQGKDSGLQLKQSLQITPHLIYDKNSRQVELSIILEGGNVHSGDQLNQGYLNSQVVLNESSSLILSGYTSDSEYQTTASIPFLGDIPLIGWLFKHKVTSNHKLTTYYIITPKIVNPFNADLEAAKITKDSKYIEIK